MFNPLDILKAPFRRDKLGLTPFDWFQLFLRRDDMLDKLKSRKLWAAVAGSALGTFLAQLGLSELMIGTILSPVIAYILGEAHIDAKAAGTPTFE